MSTLIANKQDELLVVGESVSIDEILQWSNYFVPEDVHLFTEVFSVSFSVTYCPDFKNVSHDPVMSSAMVLELMFVFWIVGPTAIDHTDIMLFVLWVSTAKRF